MTGRELRMQLRMQQSGNSRATGQEASNGGVASSGRSATREQAAELRRLVGIVAADWPADEQAEALAVALADPVAALTCFRALVAERQDAPPAPVADVGMRTCRQCANLAPGAGTALPRGGERPSAQELPS